MTCYLVFDCGCGWIGLAAREGRLIRSTLPMQSRSQALVAAQAGLGAGCVEDRSAFGDLPGRLARYFAGERMDFSDVNIDVDSQPPFIARAQRAARSIPYGKVVTYSELAKMAGSVNAARAAGTAMARNEMPIIVPCHRVVASNGIGGFSSGLEWKRKLLRLEGVDVG